MKRARGLALLINVFALGGLVGASVSSSPASALRVIPASARSAPFVPACPHAIYTVDGNVTPLFCKIDNPLALRFYASIGKHVFALGPNATPLQIEAALRADEPHSTTPELCSVYDLAAWKEGWRFPAPPTIDVLHTDCVF